MSEKGFTLVEILIVVIILGILAAIIVPQFSTASEKARASMLADDLRSWRSQLEVFKAQHRDVPAGYPDCDPAQAPDEGTLVSHMTLASDSDGQTAAVGTPGFRWGPYMSRIPQNPVNGKDTVEVLADGAAVPVGDGSHGFIYQPATMTLKPDLAGNDPDGKPYEEY